jgi:hypothetical protein
MRVRVTISADGKCIKKDFEDWGGWVDKEQLQWFGGVVKASGTKPMLVFAHHPVHNTTKRSEREKGSIHASIDMWSILEQKEGVGIYFNEMAEKSPASKLHCSQSESVGGG